MIKPTQLWDFALSKQVLGVVALIGFVAIFRPDWFHEKKPELVIEMISNSDILGVRAPLAKLKVFYDQKELADSSQTIRLVTLRVMNAGNESVKIGDFDPKFPLGIVVRGGELIEIPTIVPSNEYQKSIQIISARSPTSLSFSPMILDQGDFFTVGFLVLTRASETVEITPTGKVAGNARVRFVNAIGTDKESTVQKSFGGGLDIQASRMVVYFFGAILGLVAIAALVSIPTDVIDAIRVRRYRAERKSHIEQFIRLEKLRRDPIYNLIFQQYLNQPLRRRNPFDGLIYAVRNNVDIATIIAGPGSVRHHPVFDDPLEWSTRRGSLLEIFLGPVLRPIKDMEGDLMQNVESLKQKVTKFDEFLQIHGIVLANRIQRSIDGFWYSDKYREEEFAWT